MYWLHRLFQWVSHTFKKTDVLLKGVPFNMRVVLHPDELLKLYTKYQIKKHALDVNLRLGPINRVLGQYHLETGQIDVDVLEIAMSRIKQGTPEELDREITKVLAHEFRHAQQREHHSWFAMKWDQLLIMVFVTLLGWTFVGCTTGVIVFNLMFKWGLLSKLVGVVALLFLWFQLKLVFRLAMILGYRWCWVERDARRYEQASVDDPEWKNVITVTPELLSYQEARAAAIDLFLHILNPSDTMRRVLI